MELNAIILWGLMGCFCIILFGTTFYFYNENQNNSNYAQTLNNTITEKNDLIQNQTQEINTLKENDTYTKIQLNNLKQEKLLIQQDLNNVGLVAIKCFWALQYWTDYEGTVEHFGEDYYDSYIAECTTYANKYWDKFKSAGQ